MECTRRPLLAGAALTVSTALTGSAGAGLAAEDDDADDADPATDVDSLLEYVPESVGDDATLAVADHEALREADDPYGSATTVPYAYGTGIDEADVDRSVTATVYDLDDPEDPETTFLALLAGDVDLDVDTEAAEAPTGTTYQVGELDGDQVGNESVFVAETDDFVALASDRNLLDDAFVAAADDGDVDSLVEAEPAFEEALEAFDGADRVTATRSTDGPTIPTDADDIEWSAQATTVEDPDTMELRFGYEFADEADATEAVSDDLERTHSEMQAFAEVSSEVDGSRVTVTAVRDLAAERELADHQPPGTLSVDEVDPDADEVLVEVGTGDPTPAEDLVLEVDGEEYDRAVWADGADEIGEGDAIVLEADDVEPNTSLTLTHEHEGGSSSTTSRILTHFAFDFEYDLHNNAKWGTLTITYEDDYPLDGDRLTLATYEDQPAFAPAATAGDDDAASDRTDPEPDETDEPWTGETLSTGDEAAIDRVTPGSLVVVGWDGTSLDDAIAQHTVAPPATAEFDYDYEAAELSVTLDPETPQPANRFELRVDGDPADEEWRGRLSSPETIRVGDVDVGDRAAVVWTETDATVGQTIATPTLTLELEEETVTHAGGDALPASSLEADAWGEGGQETVPLDDQLDETFEEGEAVDVDLGDVRSVTLYYVDGDERHYVASAHARRETEPLE